MKQEEKIAVYTDTWILHWKGLLEQKLWMLLPKVCPKNQENISIKQEQFSCLYQG